MSKQPRRKATTFTYILYDSKEDLYKIGRTTSPIKRFKTLCSRHIIEPIVVMPGDIEKKLHKDFSEYRQNHPSGEAGKTEWFRNGGKLAEYVKRFSKEDYFPINSPEVLFDDLVSSGVLNLSKSIMWDISLARFGKYSVGIDILLLIGAIKNLEYYKYGYWTKAEKHNIRIIDSAVTVSDFIIEYIKSSYVFTASTLLCNIKADNTRKIKISGDGIIPDSYVYLGATKIDKDATE